jgi:hypothetical protein
VLRARRRGGAVVLEFDAATPLQPERLIAIVQASRGRMRCGSGSVLEVRTDAADHDQTIAEVDALLQRLCAA